MFRSRMLCFSASAWSIAAVCAFCLIAQPSRAAAVKMDLDGAWSVVTDGAPQPVTVPTTIPFTFGVSHWTRTFSLNLPQAPRVACLEFQGITTTATVLLNNVPVGTLTAFEEKRLDVTAALNANGVNTLEVDVDDRLLPQTIPGGNTLPFVTVFGGIGYTFPIAWAERPGIIRPVTLIYSSRPVIDATFVQPAFTPDLSHVNVRVHLRVRGATPQQVGGLVAMTLSGVYVGGCTLQPSLQNGDEVECVIGVDSPALWSPSHPALYDLWVQLADAGGVADSHTERIGLRKISTQGNQLLLNNQPLFLRGITRHDIYPGRDFVADDVTLESDLRWIKQLGVNYIRCIHYPPDRRLAQRADELGILLSEEIPSWAAFNEPAVLAGAEEMLLRMVERDYNRASVIAWFVGCGRPSDSATYLNQTTALVHAMDASRLVSFVFDNNAYLPADIQSNVSMARAAGMNAYVQNAYYFASVMSISMPAMPTDMPVIVAEWSGSEGSDRGDLGVAPPGSSGVISFPDYQLGGNGTPEYFEAVTLLNRGSAWLGYTCPSPTGSPCISGLTYFNWQDFEWPGMPYFYPGHFAFDRNGLVYEDRGPKVWPLAAFQAIMAALPHPQ